MKALVLTAYNHLEIQDWPCPEIAADEVLLRVAACGVCGSDIHGMDGSTGRRQPPIIMGHEAAGTIVEVGAEVRDWAAGDRVTFDSTIYCGRCWHCRRGEINLCDHRRVLGVSCDDYRRHGAFAELVAVPQHVLYRVPADVSFVHAALVEPLSIALHAVARTRVTLGDTAVVVGTGMIGLLVVQALRAAGCGRIYGVDVDARRLQMACQFGADEGFRSDATDVKAEILRRTGGRGADLAVEAVGATATVRLALACLRKGGQLTLVGNLAPQIEFPLQAAVTREITIRGSCASRGEYPACLEMIARGRMQVAPLVSAVAPLSEGPQWFARLHRGGEGLMKVVLEP
jgi:L-iditol 2-dehydrogenase